MVGALPFATCSGWPTAGLTLVGMNVSAAYAKFARDLCPTTPRTTRNLPLTNTPHRCVPDMKFGDMTDCIQPESEIRIDVRATKRERLLSAF
jgi:hypothetical protein